ncbi:MAG: CapA family protein [Candidatus Cloacimonetes bacterium]|nr:CapA family protein [Candidatus Cloacimonadota bacterium]MDY0366042.1 CapA family protein [Candidatus Syntrophosphaera sp.]
MVNIAFGHPESCDLFITGDFCPVSDHLNHELKLEAELTATLQRARLRSVNLECPITSQLQAIKKTGPALKAPASALALFKVLGINLVNLANNHMMDYGMEGAKDTLASLEGLGILHAGLGRVGDESSPVAEIGSRRVAFVSFTENELSTLVRQNLRAHPLDHYFQLRQIRQAKASADYVVVQYHGGAEGYPYPSPGQKRYARYMVELGASLVVCHHSHCYSGFETYQDVPIFYGLGNFYFPKDYEPASFYTGLGLCVNFQETPRVNVIGVKLDINSGTLSSSIEDTRVVADSIVKLNAIINSDTKLQTEWDHFCAATKRSSLSALDHHPRINKLLIKIGVKKDVSNWATLGLLNRIRCETHRERMLTVLMKVLEEKSEI